MKMAASILAAGLWFGALGLALWIGWQYWVVDITQTRQQFFWNYWPWELGLMALMGSGAVLYEWAND